MTDKFATVLCACLLCLTALAQGIHAEEYTDVPADTPAAAVEETPAQEAPAPAAEDAARVPVEFDAEALAEALTQAMATPTPDPDATPTPEPTAAPTIWDKPFNDYSPTEGLLLVIFVALCFLALLIWLR